MRPEKTRCMAAVALIAALASACSDSRERTAPTATKPPADAKPSDAKPSDARPSDAKPDPQSFAQAIQIACDAREKAELPPESAGEVNRAMVLAAWIDRHVQNREVRQLMGGSAAQTAQGKIDALQAGARRAGITRCALVDLWLGSRAEETGAAAPPLDPGAASAEP